MDFRLRGNEEREGSARFRRNDGDRTARRFPSFLEPRKASEQALVAVVHFVRNALAHVPRRQHQMVAAVIRTAFVQENHDQARAQWQKTADKLRGQFPRLAELMDETEDDVLAHMAFPKEHWPQIASTNPLERVNKEIERRARVIGIFPNDAAIVRLVGALLGEQTDEWQVTRRYMSREVLAKLIDPDNPQALLEARKVA